MAKSINKKAAKPAKVKASFPKQDLPNPHRDLLNEVAKFMEERIADGGATTDHLKGMLTRIKPVEPEKTEEPA